MKDKVLSVLESHNGYVSGEYLSKILGVSRTAVWKAINRLREDGYVIDSVTNRGYCLKKKADQLNTGLISSGLETSVVGTRIEVMKTVDSTNEEIKRRAATGEESGLLIAAERQTGGKGRLGRSWKSDSGGLYFTFLLRPELPPNEISGITLAAGYGVCVAVREFTGLDARIKWPNDIIIGSKKICGILTEMTAQTDRVDFVAVGIGINVNNKEFPEEIKDKATSLYLESGMEIDRNDFLSVVIGDLDIAAGQFLSGFPRNMKEHFKSLCATLGRNVTAHRGGRIIEGTAVDITDEGNLLIRDNSGEPVEINSGEVVVQGIY